jgi:hypothetical protein
MKLFEAMRLGSMATKQGFGSGSIYSNTAPCALGAARLAAGIQYSSEYDGTVYVSMRTAFPVLETSVNVPELSNPRTSLVEAIWRMNDELRWSRERIADFVEQVESRQTEVKEVEEVEEVLCHV